MTIIRARSWPMINNVRVLSDEHVPSGQEAMVKQGLTSFANTLLDAK